MPWIEGMLFPASYLRPEPEGPDIVSCLACTEDRPADDGPCPRCGDVPFRDDEAH